MKINEKMFSLPPYISTNWGNVAALHMRDGALVINMIDGETVEIPKLKPGTLELIFDSHAKFLEENSKSEQETNQAFGVFPFQQEGQGDMGLPFKFGIGAMDAWGAALQHNPNQANMDPLPDEVLKKVRSIAKIISPDDPMAMPKPEPHCNCMHCQIARAINQGLGLNDMYQKEQLCERTVDSVSDEEKWDIRQIGDKVYTVVNKRNSEERYSVSLNQPIGCTCGKEGCIHILAVLRS